MVSAHAHNRAEAGVVLRFQDLRNYIVALYNPALEAMYFFERKDGSVAPFFTYRIPHLGMVDVPEIGSSLLLTAAASGDYVAMVLDDGQQSYYTPPVKVDNVQAGRVGLWRSDIGEPQQYSDIKVSKTEFAAPSDDNAEEGLHLIRSGEDASPSIPSPQDWVLVLKNTEVKDK